MSNREKRPAQVLQGTLDLIVLRTLATMGPQHAYQIASRLQQLSGQSLELNQGTLYPALVRLGSTAGSREPGAKQRTTERPSSTS
jgi:PadR family transcriptional regulator, regulatory protein PadR